jgi:hypothetical protein
VTTCPPLIHLGAHCRGARLREVSRPREGESSVGYIYHDDRSADSGKSAVSGVGAGVGRSVGVVARWMSCTRFGRTRDVLGRAQE